MELRVRDDHLWILIFRVKPKVTFLCVTNPPHLYLRSWCTSGKQSGNLYSCMMPALQMEQNEPCTVQMAGACPQETHLGCASVWGESSALALKNLGVHTSTVYFKTTVNTSLMQSCVERRYKCMVLAPGCCYKVQVRSSKCGRWTEVHPVLATGITIHRQNQGKKGTAERWGFLLWEV